MNNQSFSKIWIIVLIVLVGGGILIYQYFGAPKEETKAPEESAEKGIADWKTYRNEGYGFEIKYPSEFTLSFEGPNFAQQAIDRGEQISGTVQLSYDTIILSDSYNELGRIEIFHKYEKDILEENYKDKGYLYLFGPCDIRWEFKPEFFSLNFINNIKILTVKGKDQGGVSQNCNYLKNLEGNLIVISNQEYKSDIFNHMLSTFRFLE